MRSSGIKVEISWAICSWRRLANGGQHALGQQVTDGQPEEGRQPNGGDVRERQALHQDRQAQQPVGAPTWQAANIERWLALRQPMRLSRVWVSLSRLMVRWPMRVLPN